MPAPVRVPCQQRILRVNPEGRKGRKGRIIFLQYFGASVISRKEERTTPLGLELRKDAVISRACPEGRSLLCTCQLASITAVAT